MNREPFWEKAYRTGTPDRFGSASPEILEMLDWLPPRSTVLDLGCGAGRNALPLARSGMDVTAVDVSRAACARIREIAEELSLSLRIVQEDLRNYEIVDKYDVVIAHGVLHLLSTSDRVALLDRMKSHTVPRGVNVVAVFTNRIPPPPDLKDVTVGLFDEGELFDAYRHWEVILKHAYTMNDEHPGGIRHEHPVNKVVARNHALHSEAVCPPL